MFVGLKVVAGFSLLEIRMVKVVAGISLLEIRMVIEMQELTETLWPDLLNIL